MGNGVTLQLHAGPTARLLLCHTQPPRHQHVSLSTAPLHGSAHSSPGGVTAVIRQTAMEGTHPRALEGSYRTLARMSQYTNSRRTGTVFAWGPRQIAKAGHGNTEEASMAGEGASQQLRDLSHKSHLRLGSMDIGKPGPHYTGQLHTGSAKGGRQ